MVIIYYYYLRLSCRMTYFLHFFIMHYRSSRAICEAIQCADLFVCLLCCLLACSNVNLFHSWSIRGGHDKRISTFSDFYLLPASHCWVDGPQEHLSTYFTVQFHCGTMGHGGILTLFLIVVNFTLTHFTVVTECICTLCLCCCTLCVALSVFFRVCTSFDLLRMCYVLWFRRHYKSERQRERRREGRTTTSRMYHPKEKKK